MRARIDARVRRDPDGPGGRLRVIRPPRFFAQRAMDREILGARAEIPPAAFLRNDATDPAARADPFGEDWNKGDLLA